MCDSHSRANQMTVNEFYCVYKTICVRLSELNNNSMRRIRGNFPFHFQFMNHGSKDIVAHTHMHSEFYYFIGECLYRRVVRHLYGVTVAAVTAI